MRDHRERFELGTSPCIGRSRTHRLHQHTLTAHRGLQRPQPFDRRVHDTERHCTRKRRADGLRCVCECMRASMSAWLP